MNSIREIKCGAIFVAFLIAILFSTTGCSWTYRSMVYVPESVPNGWSAVFKHGSPPKKQGGGPDQEVLTYVNNMFELSIQSQYRDVLWRPWFAVLFRFPPDERDVFLHLWIRITKKESSLEIDPLKWPVMINDAETALSPSLSHQAEFRGTEYLTVKYNVKVDAVYRLKIRFEGIKSGGGEIHIPDLELIKRKGSLIKEQFTL